MAIMRTTWDELVLTESFQTQMNKFKKLPTATNTISELCIALDSLVTEKLGVENAVYNIGNMLEYIGRAYFGLTGYTHTNWEGMPLVMSSYKIKDTRIVNLIYNNLIQYMGFYQKVLTDEGFARTLSLHREYSDSGESSGNNKNYYSETPQIQLTNFDEAINYASSLEKNEDAQENSREGESTTTSTHRSWDETVKGMKMMFFDELVNYISRIPNMIYSYYSLDNLPVPELVQNTFNYFKQMKDIYER